MKCQVASDSNFDKALLIYKWDLEITVSQTNKICRAIGNLNFYLETGVE